MTPNDPRYKEADGPVVLFGRTMTTNWRRYEYRIQVSFNVEKLKMRCYVDATFAAGMTYGDVIREIGKRNSFEVATIPEPLNKRKLTRDRLFRDNAFSVIDQLLRAFDHIYWWVSEDCCLQFHAYPSQSAPLSAFEKLAGKIYVETRRPDGRLPRPALLKLAKTLDDSGFSLANEIPHKVWMAIQEHNRKFAVKSVTTFEHAVQSRHFRHDIQRCLYRARDNFLKNPS